MATEERVNDARWIRKVTIIETVRTFLEILFVNRLREEAEHTIQWDENNQCVRIYVKRGDIMLWKEVLERGRE